MSNGDDALLSPDDAAAIGHQVVEMAERVNRIHPITPGAVAKWHFTMDDVLFAVVVGVAEDGK